MTTDPAQAGPTIPSHWRCMKLKHIASLKSGESITAEDISDTGAFPVYGGNGIRGFTSSFTHSGDFPLIGRQGALCGNINYASGEFWASEHAVVVSVVPGYSVHWLGELLRSMNLNQYSQSAAQPGIAVEAIANLSIPVPPLEEQQAIAAYLKSETENIDGLIAEKERMLALLDEKRAALIGHSVIRGLNRNAPLERSELDWLGEIPAHWRVRRLKFVIESLDQGSSPIASNNPAGEFELGVLKLSAISRGRFRREENKALGDADGSEQTHSLRRGDVLITRGNTPQLVADVACVPQDEPNLLIPDLVYRLRVRPSEAVPEYLAYFLVTSEARVQIRQDARGSSGSMVKVSQGDIADWRMPLPPLQEQVEIVSHLQAADAHYEVLRNELSSSVALLAERRASLISAAVTGQISLMEMAT